MNVFLTLRMAHFITSPFFDLQTKTQRILHIKTKIENSKDIDDSEQVYDLLKHQFYGTSILKFLSLFMKIFESVTKIHI